MKRQPAGSIRQLMIHAVLLILSFPILFMLFWLVKSTFVDPYTGQITLNNWEFLFRDTMIDTITLPVIWPMVGFTLLFSILVMGLDVLIAVPAAYAASRLEFKGKIFLIKSLFMLQAFPGILVLIAVFYIMIYVGLVNTLAGVVLLCAVHMLPAHVFMLKGFFDSIPWDLEQASMVDGCTRFQAFHQVLLPAVKPGILVIAIFAFMASYGEWFLFSVFIFDDTYFTMARYMSTLVMSGSGESLDGTTVAFGVFYTVPIAIFYIFSQKMLLQIKNLGGRKFV